MIHPNIKCYFPLLRDRSHIHKCIVTRKYDFEKSGHPPAFLNVGRIVPIIQPYSLPNPTVTLLSHLLIAGNPYAPHIGSPRVRTLLACYDLNCGNCCPFELSPSCLFHGHKNGFSSYYISGDIQRCSPQFPSIHSLTSYTNHCLIDQEQKYLDTQGQKNRTFFLSISLMMAYGAYTIDLFFLVGRS